MRFRATALAATIAVLAAGCGGGDDDELSQPERVEKFKPYVVSISGKKAQVGSEGNVQVYESGGTGTVIDAERALVLTNAHVMAGLRAAKGKVGESESPATVVGQAPCQDLAVIKLTTPPPGLKEAPLGDSDKLKAGEHVTSLGFPASRERGGFAERSFATTEGSVSTPKQKYGGEAALPSLPNVIRNQTPISGGNSGGPLINDDAELIGVTTISGEEEVEKLQAQNIAIASNQVKPIVEQLKAGKNLAYTGWGLVVLEQAGGTFVFVEGVDPGSHADEAKFRSGDVITEVDGQPVSTVADVCEILESKPPGSSIKVSGYENPYKQRNFYRNVKVKLAK
jgi:S1-C subfamily serine protease